MPYSTRFDEAVALVVADFRSITRKGTDIPYISHLFAVTALVAEAGGDEDLLIAALLHDWLEDVPGADPAEIERRFGTRVRTIVEALSDTTEHPKPPWRARKEGFLARIRSEPPDVKLVCTADKLHNVQTLVRDVDLHGPATLARFRGGVDGTLWYHREIANALADGFEHWLVGDLVRAVDRLHLLAEKG